MKKIRDWEGRLKLSKSRCFTVYSLIYGAALVPPIKKPSIPLDRSFYGRHHEKKIFEFGNFFFQSAMVCHKSCHGNHGKWQLFGGFVFFSFPLVNKLQEYIKISILGARKGWWIRGVLKRHFWPPLESAPGGVAKIFFACQPHFDMGVRIRWDFKDPS